MKDRTEENRQAVGCAAPRCAQCRKCHGLDAALTAQAAELARQFWEEIEAELDRQSAAVRAYKARPVVH